MTQPVRVLLVDDDVAMRRSLRQILTDELPASVIDEAASCAEALARVKAHPCDVVLLDIRLPDRTGLDLLPELRAARPALPVVVLTALAEGGYAQAAMRAGAAAFVAKDRAPEELVPTIGRVVWAR